MALSGAVTRLVSVVGQVVIVEAWNSQNGQIGLNRSHWRVTNVGGAGLTLGQLLGNFSAPMAAAYIPVLCSLAEFNGLGMRVLQPMSPTPVSAAAYDSDDAGPGTGGATPIPTQVCGILSLRSGSSGRSGRGRAYIPFPDTSRITALTGEPTVAYTALLNAIATFLITPRVVTVAGNSLSLTPVIYNARNGLTEDLEFGAAEAKWATQRRRGDFGRVNTVPFV